MSDEHVRRTMTERTSASIETVVGVSDLDRRASSVENPLLSSSAVAVVAAEPTFRIVQEAWNRDVTLTFERVSHWPSHRPLHRDISQCFRSGGVRGSPVGVEVEH